MAFILAYFLQKIIPYLGFFPYKEILADYHLPSFVSSFANFDGVHYLILAKNGYSQYEHAFFPLYPLLIKLLTPVFFGNALVAGLVISNISFLLGLIIFYRYLRIILVHGEVKTPVFRDLGGADDPAQRGRSTPTEQKNMASSFFGNPTTWSTIFLLVFPTSFFFFSLYTEGLFFLLFISSLYFLKKEKYLTAAVFAFLASLTRLIGVFLVIPFAVNLYQKLKIKNQNDKLKIKNNKNQITSNPFLITIFSPVLGLLVYSLYLYFTTGDPLAFFSSQPAFGANRSTKLIFLPQVYYRYIKIFLTAAPDFRYWVSVFEFVVFNFVLFVLIIDFLKLLRGVRVSFFNLAGGGCREERDPDGAQARGIFEASTGGNESETGPAKTPHFDLLGLNIFSIINLILPTLTGTLSSIPRYALFSLSFYIALAQIKNTVVKIALAIFMAIFHFVALGLFIQGYFIA